MSKERAAHLNRRLNTYEVIRPKEVQALVEAVKDCPIVYLFEFKVCLFGA